MSLKKLLKPFKLLTIARQAGVVTVLYPYQKPLVTTEYRGKISIDPSKCIGCGACVNACPPNALSLSKNQGMLAINYFIGRCIFCGRCAEVCPTGAITITQEFELASTNLEDLNAMIVHKLRNCEECGKYFAPNKMIEHIISKLPNTEKYANICPECRKNRFLRIVSKRRR